MNWDDDNIGTKHLATNESYAQCRDCGQCHNFTARDCGITFIMATIPSKNEVWRVLDGELWLVKDTTPPRA